jgi:putative membrane protein
MYLITRWLLNTLALVLVVMLLKPHLDAPSLKTLAIAALVLGLLNAIVKPILFVLTLPLTIITLGLFLIVLNAIMLIESFGWAIVGAVILGLISLVTNHIGGKS